MITLYVGGKVVSWADAEALFAEAAATQSVEFRNAAGPFFTLEEIRKQWGEE